MACARIDLSIFLILLFLGTMQVGVMAAYGYPWIHYFERPDMPYIHCAFADADGNIIVSTGDIWNSRQGPPGYYWQEYWSEGMFLINEDSIEPISCPENTYVYDCATDDTGRTWVLYGIGHDELVEMPYAGHGEPEGLSGVKAESQHGPTIMSSRGVSDITLGYVDEFDLIEYQGLINRIPARARSMCSAPDGRIFVTSAEWNSDGLLSFHVSWWQAGDPPEVWTFDVKGKTQVEGSPDSYYPEFGPDGQAYILVSYSMDRDNLADAVLSLDPDTNEWDILDSNDCAFLNSRIVYFHVDMRNMRWFGTEDGLVLYDGENWARFTTENNQLAHDRVRFVKYDEIEGAYYVGSTAFAGGITVHDSALNIFSTEGARLFEPFFIPHLLIVSPLHRGSGDVWYLMPGWDDDLFYMYDHINVREFRLRDLADIPMYTSSIHYIGPTGGGRTFFAAYSVIMIW